MIRKESGGKQAAKVLVIYFSFLKMLDAVRLSAGIFC